MSITNTEGPTINAMRGRQRALEQEIALKQEALNRLKVEIEARIKESRVIFSDHALVRYLERVRGIDMQEVREEMLPSLLKEQIATLGSGTFPVNGGKFQLRVKKHVIVTVICDESDKE